MPQELLFELKGARVTPHIATSRGAWGRKPPSQRSERDTTDADARRLPRYYVCCAFTMASRM
jgi:hypothetical protein